jgi:hypothetical protein
MNRPLLSPLLAGAAVLTAAGPARAAPCSTLPAPVVYVTGSGKVTMKDLGTVLAMNKVATIVYFNEQSCLAIDAIVNGAPINTTSTNFSASYWDAVGNQQSCDLPVAAPPMGQRADIGISDIFPATCNSLPNGLPTNVHDFFGPIEAYVFVVPSNSMQTSISREAAYFVYGFGSGSGVAPWTDQTYIFQRDPASGSQVIMGLAIGVPPTKFQATSTMNSADMLTKVGTSMIKPEATIGFLSGEVSGMMGASTVKGLAYQDSDQTCGYWPDSTATAKDKRNVRDGHYAIWGPLHLLTTVDNQGYPTNLTAKSIIAYLTGTEDLPGGDIIKLAADAGIVPECAMQVTRTSELGPLASFQPLRSCGCYFDSLTSGTTTCQACMANADCPMPTPRCNYNFCEAQ